MSRYRLTHEAQADLDSIADFIATDHPAAADRLLAKIDARCQSLAEMPGLGRMRDEIAPDLRSSRVGAYLILYVEEAGGVAVLRVVHGHRDLPSLFD